MKKAEKARILKGDSLNLLRTLDDESVDAVLTDPPYNSGGIGLGAKQRPTSTKYQSNNVKVQFPDFCGDNRDQRSFVLWATLWLAECHRAAKPGATLMMFSDWRQLPAMTDALQAGGWLWKAVVVWDKPTARPCVGGFKNQCEYVLVGVKGFHNKAHRRCLPGLYRVSIVSGKKRRHCTEKPVPLLKQLLEIAPVDGVVLDPFMGAGSTGQACLETRRRFIGMEMSEAYYSIAQDFLLNLP